MFSAQTKSPTTLTLAFSLARVCIIPNTDAAPHISHFISSIAEPGLSEIPPVSKVMPLPTRTSGCLSLAPPLYSIVIILDGSSLPLPTDRYEPIFNLSRSFSLRLDILRAGKSFLRALVLVSIIRGVQ